MARLCTEPDCDRPHRARGLCSTHYNDSRYTREERYRTVNVACGHCGVVCTKTATRKYDVRFCSLLCRDLWRIDTATNAAPPVRSPRAPRSEIPAEHPARWYGSSSPLVYADCSDCGGVIIKRGRRHLCISCATARRYARRASRWRARRLEVFERDRWICWLCGHSVDPLLCVPDPRAATVDHVLPVHHGGTDDLDNLACAHMGCNSRRGDSLTRLTLTAA